MLCLSKLRGKLSKTRTVRKTKEAQIEGRQFDETQAQAMRTCEKAVNSMLKPLVCVSDFFFLLTPLPAYSRSAFALQPKKLFPNALLNQSNLLKKSLCND